MQVFDFKKLLDWRNIHICITPTDEDLYNLFQNEDTPLPSIFYGTQPERYSRFLATVIPMKDEFTGNVCGNFVSIINRCQSPNLVKY